MHTIYGLLPRQVCIHLCTYPFWSGVFLGWRQTDPTETGNLHKRSQCPWYFCGKVSCSSGHCGKGTVHLGCKKTYCLFVQLIFIDLLIDHQSIMSYLGSFLQHDKWILMFILDSNSKKIHSFLKENLKTLGNKFKFHVSSFPLNNHDWYLSTL